MAYTGAKTSFQLPGWTNNSPYNSATTGDRNHELPHHLAMIKESQTQTHPAIISRSSIQVSHYITCIPLKNVMLEIACLRMWCHTNSKNSLIYGSLVWCIEWSFGCSFGGSAPQCVICGASMHLRLALNGNNLAMDIQLWSSSSFVPHLCRSSPVPHADIYITRYLNIHPCYNHWFAYIEQQWTFI
jgi:hypothetical protein